MQKEKFKMTNSPFLVSVSVGPAAVTEERGKHRYNSEELANVQAAMGGPEAAGPPNEREKF